MNKRMEIRFKPVELRYDDSDNEMMVSGYVNLTEQFSNILRTQHSNHQFIEKIEKGAFNRALTRSDEIDFLAEHDSNLILSTTRNNTLSLREDDKGLFMSAKICPTSWGKDYYTLVKSGILQNFSFGFRALEDEWRDRPDGLLERTIKDLELFEVSVVKNPAYPQSNIQARHLDIITDDELVKEALENREVKPMDKQKLKDEEKELREDVNQGADTEEDDDVDIESLFSSLERTVLALDVKIEKLYDMVEEKLIETERDTEKGKTESDEKETEEEVDPEKGSDEDRSVEETTDETRDEKPETSTETEGEAVETEDEKEEEVEKEPVDDEKSKEEPEETVETEKETIDEPKDDKKNEVIEELNKLKDIINSL